MFEEIYDTPPIPARGKLKSHLSHSTRGPYCRLENKFRVSAYGFQCHHCQAYVFTLPVFSGVQNRNHCPFCLWSRHVDLWKAGDRMSACKAIMQPIGLAVKLRLDKYGQWKYGELMLIHRCNDCEKLSINRIAADDQDARLMDIYRESLSLDMNTREEVNARNIHLLQADDVMLVVNQLWGAIRI